VGENVPAARIGGQADQNGDEQHRLAPPFACDTDGM